MMPVRSARCMLFFPLDMARNPPRFIFQEFKVPASLPTLICRHRHSPRLFWKATHQLQRKVPRFQASRLIKSSRPKKSLLLMTQVTKNVLRPVRPSTLAKIRKAMMMSLCLMMIPKVHDRSRSQLTRMKPICAMMMTILEKNPSRKNTKMLSKKEEKSQFLKKTLKELKTKEWAMMMMTTKKKWKPMLITRP